MNTKRRRIVLGPAGNIMNLPAMKLKSWTDMTPDFGFARIRQAQPNGFAVRGLLFRLGRKRPSSIAQSWETTEDVSSRRVEKRVERTNVNESLVLTEKNPGDWKKSWNRRL